MKTNLKKQLLKCIPLMVIVLSFVACQNDENDFQPARYSTTAEIFTDGPIGMGTLFYLPYGGSKLSAWSVDDEVSYLGTSSMRFDVPNANDPEGSYAGAIFRVDGAPRDLTQYDALTFWVKAAQGVTIGEFGFGEDFIDNKYIASISNVSVGTTWTKIVIPIPDASKLTQERGMFRYATGTQSTNGVGYTFWIDELKFEKLGTNLLLYPYILNGEDRTVEGFTGSEQIIDELGAVYSLANGQNVTVKTAPSYFEFIPSNTEIITPLTLNNFGQIFTRIIGTSGSAVVTAQLGNSLAQGSLTINAVGEFPHASVPTRNAANVVSLFSDAYSNVPVRHYNGYFAPYQTTQGGAGNDPFNVDIKAPFANGDLDNIIHYTQLNFVSIGMYETVPNVNINGMNHLHMDINVRETVNSGDFIRIEIETGTGSTTASASYIINSTALSNADANGWVSLDIPLSSFPGLTNTSNLGQLFFISDNTISNIWVDNVYFYAQ